MKSCSQGYILLSTIIFASLAVIAITTFTRWAVITSRALRQTVAREQAIQIAEGGIDYYRWHLAHDADDYQDGATSTGSYIHQFYDKDGNAIGRFTLTITPPPLGSTLVGLRSVGESYDAPGVTRTIDVRLAKPSFAKYAVISNTDLSIGADIVGPVHSNGGINFVSGTAYNLITSALTTFNSAVTGGVTKWGVYEASDPNPPTAFTPVTSTFTAGRQVGVPALDFAGITIDLGQMKTAAIASGRYYGSSGAGNFGYHIVLQTNDTYDIYRVTSQATGGTGCEARQWWTYPNCPTVANAKWSIGNQTLIGNDVAFPSNGVIFAEDNIWVDGQINTARLTIVAANIPDVGTRRNIIVNNDLLYTNYDGQDVIGLIAQDNFWVGVASDEDLRIDAAIIAQNGRVSRYAYRNCGTNSSGSNGVHDEKTSITFYGMFASNQRYAFGNLGGVCTNPPSGSVAAFNSGYNTTRTYIYDPYLLYAPPPSFPLTSEQYVTLSWEEV
jgi:hypothetical protein